MEVIMSKKKLSTFEREMLDVDFKKAFEEGYQRFLLSELIADLMEEGHKTVRGLAEEVGISATIIQNVKSGKQKDLKISNFKSIAEACGYHIFLEKKDHRIAI